MESNEFKTPNYSHAWKGAWNRPMHVDEDSLHPFTVARMTDHNVRGSDSDEDLMDDLDRQEVIRYVEVNVWEEDGVFR